MNARSDGRPGRGRGRKSSGKQPAYARALRLRHIKPGPWACLLFLEGSIAVAVVLALADVVSFWAVLVLPVAVAIAVKLNDVVAGALPAEAAAGPAERRTSARESAPANDEA